MPPVRLPEKGSKPIHPSKKLSKSLKRKRDEEVLQVLEQRVRDFDLKSSPQLFKDLPLTSQTASGLDKAHFTSLTDIQRRAIPLTLQGRDVLGAAKTGSGKTLAFLIPVLEILYRRKWSSLDGAGALIISPTRELATQIFEVLRKIGREHTFSAGLVIGGKKLKEEQDALHRMNIVVCTPGRLLQHMDQTFGVNFENLQLLVLDEADRILDMGFKRDLDAIIENLPKERQTLLFSATQTKSVSDLARLSLRNPEYVAVHEAADAATPTKLEQFYMVVPLDEKLDTLFSFLRNHLTAKILVFMSSCKQVRFIYETFRHLHIGTPLLHLHGKQKQSLRTEITAKFTQAKASCLFATDVVARGLDFPSVDWVVQLDAPEDVDTYIHRVGRTARFEKTGRALLFLCPSEETAIIAHLTSKKVPISRVNPKASKKTSVKPQIQNLCFKDPELKYLGQKAFVSYARSILLQKNREAFRIGEYPLEEFAAAMGLPGAPRIKGLKAMDRDKAKILKNMPHGLKKLEQQGSDESEDDEPSKQKKVRTKYDRMVERQNQNVLAGHYHKLQYSGDEGSDDDDGEAGFLQVKRRGYDSTPEAEQDEKEMRDTPVLKLGGGKTLPIDSKRRAELAMSKKQIAKRKSKGQKLLFDDDGQAHAVYELEDEEDFHKKGGVQEQRQQFLEEEREKRKTEEEEDRKLAKQKRREKREKRKMRERMLAEEDEEGAGGGVQFEEYAPPPEWQDSESAESEEQGEGGRQKGKRRRTEVEPAYEESLEDLERLASGFLA